MKAIAQTYLLLKQIMNIGDKFLLSCTEWDEQRNCPCSGWLVGTYGGKFHFGDAEYKQCLDATCSKCGVFKSEVFEIWNEKAEEYHVSDRLIIPISNGDTISFPGLGRAVHKLGVEQIEDILESMSHGY